jgi:hypothetical protein
MMILWLHLVLASLMIRRWNIYHKYRLPLMLIVDNISSYHVFKHMLCSYYKFTAISIQFL